MMAKEKHPPEYYAQGLHLTQEERRKRYYEMQERQTMLDAAKAADKIKPLPADTEDVTQERLKKAGEEVEDFITDTGKRTRRMQDVLDAMFSKGARYPINGDQYAAGRQWQHDWDESGAGKISAVDPTRDVVDGGQARDMTARAIDAQGRYRRAQRAVGHEMAHILFHVLLLEEKLSVYGAKWLCQKNEKLGDVAARAVLRLALTALAHHYGFVKNPHMQAAHTAGYRPKIQGAS